MGGLQGKVALVTGAGQGVGQGIALALAGEGVSVAVAGRTEAKLEATCELIRERGGRAEPFPIDVADTDAVPAVVEQVVSSLGGIDVLVNNAYTGAYGPLLSMSDDDFQRGFRTAPFAAFAFMKACHPHLKARSGSVINLVSSAMVRWDTSTYGAYAAAKQALKSLTRTAAAEWGRDGIRVNAIAPHALSPGLKTWTERNPEEAAEFVASIPLGRIGDCEADIGRAVVALVGPDLRYLTGATVPLDGGQAFFG
ncbi:NAD(P)-dependent dehydrogenase, short-chain alcohol dehydrogenase family [Saccharopolyspora kobensis]|uniref:NAD(P)-dependent dehydrogenase, short-chain alcohol dehydrogenase family n=1 Tax=Saccharopolyspora kobensis TaxID=146035 RepID=A0A1H5W0B8_9PSEU|nr:SDR family oxidoreductase [Saccharopolyspora kobensis]SEF92571.1 NAD(P)-dependent dehydrogenase, short-chain alcohol dehydrogenase family [Saccharopolyspora kobensis]SFC55033.1 NAD(P)-dependent dehydrogenase, short-chain alcohol dehydrogenase family [Saccharopolyspora kobensis]